MKRTVIAAMAGLLMAGLAAIPAAAGDAKGPPCSDIVDGGAFADDDSVNVRMVLAKPSCSFVTYRVTVYDEPGGALLGTATTRGTGATVLIFSVATTDRDEGDCTYFFVTSETLIKGHVADEAPDGGLLAVGFDNDLTDEETCPSEGRGHN